MIDVACVGILVADVMAKPVKEIPEKGLLTLVDSIEMYTGGNAMTASINISKMGLKSAIVGKVGNDIFGDFLRNKLNDYNVNTKGLAKDETTQTSTSLALISDDGERTFLHCTGANAKFSIKDVDWSVIEDSKIVFVTGTFLLDTFDGEQTMEFLKKCKEMGKTTALDVCFDSKNRWGKVLDMSMPYIDIFLPSIEEAQRLANTDSYEEAADVFFEKGCKSVVIKVGKKGCYVKETKNSEGLLLPTYSEFKPVDTTGAGDSFCSGFLASTAKGNGFVESAKFANAVGTHCIMEKGATTGIKSYEEILKFMEEHKC